jgi:VWFA-related protein
MRQRLGLVPVAIALFASSIVVAGHQTGRPPVFRAEANYTEIYAMVADRQGQFVPNLTADDFEIKEEGRVHPIELFSYVELPMAGSAARPTMPPIFNPELPREMRAVDNRIYLLYLNPVEPTYVAQVRELASTFVREYLLPGDVAAVWDPGLPARRAVFTDNRSLLLSAISPYLGTSLGDSDLQFALNCTPGGVSSLPSSERERCHHYLRAPKTRLDEALKWFGAIQGRRKSVVLFAAGWPHEADPATSTDVQVYAVDVRGLVPPDRALGQGMRSNAADVNGAIQSQLSALSESTELMASLSDRTGGFAITNQNDHRVGFRRIVEHNSRYYVLGYKSTVKRRDGDFRRVDVKVNRAGVRVYARRGYYAY